MLFVLRGKGIIFLLFSQHFKYSNEQGNKRDIKGQSEGKKTPDIFKTIIFPSFFLTSRVEISIFTYLPLYLQQMFTEQLHLCCSSFKGWETSTEKPDRCLYVEEIQNARFSSAATHQNCGPNTKKFHINKERIHFHRSSVKGQSSSSSLTLLGSTLHTETTERATGEDCKDWL